MMNWKWPQSLEHPENNPWYLIIWRLSTVLPTYLLIYSGKIFIVLGILLFRGWFEAKREWKRIGDF